MMDDAKPDARQLAEGTFFLCSTAAATDPELSDGAFRLLAVIGTHADSETHQGYPSTTLLGEILGISQRQVFKHLAALEQHGYLVRRKRMRKGRGTGQTSSLRTLCFPAPKKHPKRLRRKQKRYERGVHSGPDAANQQSGAEVHPAPERRVHPLGYERGVHPKNYTQSNYTQENYIAGAHAHASARSLEARANASAFGSTLKTMDGDHPADAGDQRQPAVCLQGEPRPASSMAVYIERVATECSTDSANIWQRLDSILEEAKQHGGLKGKEALDWLYSELVLADGRKQYGEAALTALHDAAQRLSEPEPF